MMEVRIIRRDTLETLFLDASPSRSYDPSVKVASHPIEGEADVTDHAQKELESFTVEGVITESPLLDFAEQQPGEDLQRKAVDFLDRAAEKPLRVITERLGRREPVLLEGYPHDVDQIEALRVQLKFREVRFAEAQTVEVPPAQTSEAGLADTQSRGDQPTSDRASEQLGFDRDVPEAFTAEAPERSRPAWVREGNDGSRDTDASILASGF